MGAGGAGPEPLLPVGTALLMVDWGQTARAAGLSLLSRHLKRGAACVNVAAWGSCFSHWRSAGGPGPGGGCGGGGGGGGGGGV